MHEEEVKGSQLWQAMFDGLQERISPQNFKIWIEPVRASLGGGTLRLHVPNQYFQEWIAQNYLQDIHEIAESVYGGSLRIELEYQEAEQLEIDPSYVPSVPLGAVEEGNFFEPFTVPKLNERYTFESFVVGPSNQFAHAACLAVANEPAGSYNPLFIYGGVGLGKTHLLHAIGWSLLEHPQKPRVLYISSEQFVNEMITAVRFDKLSEFRSRYRDQCDVLMLDDIQFIAGKKMTQEEFFHTFNFLHSSSKQIIVTSDRYPQEIPALEERLRSRFQWGLIADIQEPELETRMAIVTQKAENDGLVLDNELVLYLASSMQNNIRELEGALVRLRAFAELTGRQVTLRMARDVLRGLMPERQPVASVDVIQQIVADYYDVKIHDLRGNKRQKQILLPRQVAMYLCRKLAQASFVEIGAGFGGKDHSTAINACQRVEQLLPNDPILRSELNELESRIREG
ncbi:MAG: chromosomal replication initiator protein DnaA [Myxococcales bacterium]|nr:chromosomal replication initiator protein DnaA [Myxococcales bacterium]MCB9642399.1 chromosomal replication initiator protein DnaA [Myxococcales bacterium]